MALGALPSWAKKPWEWAAKRLRGAPLSMMQTDRRARAIYMAADRPAKLPPMIIASCRMNTLPIIGAATGNETVVNAGAQLPGQKHLDRCAALAGIQAQCIGRRACSGPGGVPPAPQRAARNRPGFSLSGPTPRSCPAPRAHVVFSPA